MPYKNKEDQAAAARRHYEANKPKMMARAQEARKQLVQEIRKYLQELKSKTPCTDCGVHYPFYVMQFDHIKGEKKFDIGRSNKWTSWTRVLEEIDKCEIVCANCHAERTYSRRGVDWS